MRLTTVPLTSKFLGELDYQTANLIKVFRAKGGVAGRKITSIMSQLDNVRFLFLSSDKHMVFVTRLYGKAHMLIVSNVFLALSKLLFTKWI